MSDRKIPVLRALSPRLARIGTAALLAAAALLSGACGGVDDGRNCCRGVLCGYPPDKNGECAGPSGETTAFLDSDGGTGWETDEDAAAPGTSDGEKLPETTRDVVTRVAPADTLR